MLDNTEVQALKKIERNVSTIVEFKSNGQRSGFIQVLLAKLSDICQVLLQLGYLENIRNNTLGNVLIWCRRVESDVYGESNCVLREASFLFTGGVR